MVNSTINILVDVGGTYIRIGVDEKDSKPLVVVRTPILKQDLLNLLEKEIHKIIKGRGIRKTKIFISCPGLIDKNGNIQKTLYTPLTGVNLSEEIRQRMGRETIVVNDANIQALGCYRKKNLLYMNIGTAIGGAYICDDRIFSGSNGFACEFGHIFVGGKKRCACGRIGCLDTIASGQSFVNKFGDQWWKNKNSYAIQEQIKVTGEAIGDALIQLSILYDPEEICITGKISEFTLFQRYVRQKFYSESWYNIPVIFRNDSWENVYLGFKKIIKGECIL